MTTTNDSNKQFKEDVKKQTNELLLLLLKKTGVKKQDLYEMITREFIKENLYLLTPAERKHFNSLAL